MAVYDCRGVPVSTADSDLVAALERCHLDSLTFQGDPVSAIDQVLESAPDFIMGHCFKAGMLTQAMEVRVLDELMASVEAAEALSHKANERERGHIAALRAWIGGDFYGAVRKWDAVLKSYPRDLLALQLVHLSNVLLGDVAGQLDCVERVIKRWDRSVPGYEFVLGFHAFGLEENGAYARADERGRQAMELRPDHPYAIHSVAHVAEMEGNQLRGIAYLNDTRESWANSTFANHNWWHLALYHLDLGRTTQVFDIYDRHLRTGAESPETYEDLDSTALLWRLMLLGVDVGPRWRDLARRWEPSAGDTLYAFNDVHAMMALVSGERPDAADWLLNATARYAERASGTNAVMTRAVGLPFSRAIKDFAEGRYADCVDKLMPVRTRTHRLGGSYAQRDVINWTLLEASLRARQFNLALRLARERCSAKQTSPQNWRFIARAHRGLGHRTRAAKAEALSQELLAA